MGEPKDCPRCGLVNPPSAQRCECGWDFVARQREQPYHGPVPGVPVGFWLRVTAYLIDVLPITAAVALVFYFFLGFNAVLHRYLSRKPGDLDARWEFLIARNRIRNLSLVLYLAYCGVMEASALRGTLGKWLLGIAVVNADGSRLTRAQATRRNSAKALSILALVLGCLWIAWSQHKQGWHDTLAGTFVVRRPGGW